MAIYLDHNATSILKPAVIDTVVAVLHECGNASSLHSAGRAARRHIEDARADVAALVAYKPANIVFTSGATETNTMIVRGHSGTVLLSGIEHPSVIETQPAALHIPVTADGLIDLAALENLLAEHRPQLVAVMAVNNETGVIQPVSEIGRLCRKAGALFHCDAVQAAGKIAIDFDGWGCDFMSLSAHKFGGPQGAGALVFRSQTPVPRLLTGGGQERRQRAGTENVAAIAGFGTAARVAVSDLPAYQALCILRDRIEAARPDMTIHGRGAPRVANTSCFSLPDRNAQTMLMQLDLDGFCVSSGAACSSGSIKPSHVLEAMGVSRDLCTGALRVSLGWNNTGEEINHFIESLRTL